MASVLVIADPAMARRLSWVLEQAGHSVRVASDPSSGIRSAEVEQPAVIVINGVVPVEELDPFIQRLTERAPASRMLEVARPAGELATRVRASGHLTQPFDADDFLREIDRLAPPG
jgi:DNA-binding response OmpR family regulator